MKLLKIYYRGKIFETRRIASIRKTTVEDIEVYVIHVYPDPAREYPYILPVEQEGDTYEIVEEDWADVS